MRVIYGTYKPDQPPHLQDGLVTADGVYSIANGYAPMKRFSASPNGDLGGYCMGAGAYRHNGEVFVFAADATDIYRYTASGYSSLVTDLSTNVSAGLRFCPFATFMLATNGTDPIQKFDPASPTAFTVLADDAPTARFLAVVRGFVVAGYADDSPLRVAWSDTGDASNWTPGGASLAGQFDMPSGGDITGVVGGEYGLIFQENRIVRMSFTGDDAIWQFDEIATDVGCTTAQSLATYGKLTFFLSNKGFMACDGNSVQAIGAEVVDRTFLALVDNTYLEVMSAVVDPRNSLYIVTVPNASPTNQVFIYNFALQRWSTARITCDRLFSALSYGLTLEDLDAIYGNLDAIPISLDSASIRGGTPQVMLFDGSHAIGTLSGDNMTATFADARQEFSPGLRARITEVRPLTDAGTVEVSVLGADSLTDEPQETVYTARTRRGSYRTRESWNFAQIKVRIPSGTPWTYAQGYDIEAMAGGRQ